MADKFLGYVQVYLNGAEFLLEKVLNLLQHGIIVQATVQEPSDYYIGPDYVRCGSQEQ